MSKLVHGTREARDHRHRPVGTLVLIGAFFTLGCDGGSATDPDGLGGVRAMLTLVTERSDLLYRSGAVLPDSVVLQLLTPGGDPLARGGVSVEWTVQAGEGTVSGDPVTDASGRATAIWTLGDEEGLQRLQAEVGDGVRPVVEVLAVTEVRPVVYVANPGGWAGGPGSRLHTVSPDGSGDTQLTMGGIFPDSWPQWSPDGSRVAFFRQFDNACSSIQGDIMILDVGSLKVTRVTDDGSCAVAQGLAWSPDGTRIAMSRNDDIVILDLETGSRTVVIESPEQARLPQWGPLGIAYARRLPPDPARTHLVEPDGSGDRVLMDDEGTSIHPLGWDPEGRRLTTFFNRPGGAPLVRIWDAETGEITTVPRSVGGWWGAWSPDGTEVLVTVGGSAIGVCADQNRDYIVRVDLETEEAVPVTPQCGTPSAFPTWRRVIDHVVDARERRG